VRQLEKTCSTPSFFIILFVLSISVPHTYSSSQTLIYVTPPLVLTEVGENFTINVDVENAPDFNSFSFQLKYNTSILDTLEVEIQVPLACEYAVNETNGNILVYGWSVTSTVSGNLTLASIKFNATLMGRSNLDLYDTYFTIEGSEIQHDSIDGYMDTNLTLSINVGTDKDFYYPEHIIQVNGTLYIGGFLISDGLVAVELDDPDHEPILFRTLTTGEIGQENWKIKIPKFDVLQSSVIAGYNVYLNITVENLSEDNLPLVIAFTLYDVDGYPIGYTYIQDPCFVNGTTMWYECSICTPDTAPNGTATLYANVYSGFPRVNGTPYCLEKSASFLILSSIPSEGTSIPPQNGNESYYTAFKLPLGKGYGTFNVHVSSEYKMRKAYSQTAFNATLLGDIDRDGVVYLNDLDLFGRAWYTSEGDSNYNPDCDFDNDGLVYLTDLNAFGKNWYKQA
jgi:hypothetical protein